MNETYSSCPFCDEPATPKEIVTDVYSGVQKPTITIGYASCITTGFPLSPRKIS